MLRLTFLGTGTSQGVPMIGCDCEVCRSRDHHDKRLRSSVMIERFDATPPVHVIIPEAATHPATAHGAFDRPVGADGRIVIDVSGEEKKKLTVPQLLELFSKVSGSDEADDKLLLS